MFFLPDVPPLNLRQRSKRVQTARGTMQSSSDFLCLSEIIPVYADPGCFQAEERFLYQTRPKTSRVFRVPGYFAFFAEAFSVLSVCTYVSKRPSFVFVGETPPKPGTRVPQVKELKVGRRNGLPPPGFHSVCLPLM